MSDNVFEVTKGKFRLSMVDGKIQIECLEAGEMSLCFGDKSKPPPPPNRWEQDDARKAKYEREEARIADIVNTLEQKPVLKTYVEKLDELRNLWSSFSPEEKTTVREFIGVCELLKRGIQDLCASVS